MDGMDAPVLRVGCAMWGHKPWIGRWFPPTTRADATLAAYVALLPAVEGNTTFYGLPEARTVDRWSAQAPSSFRFCFKLPRTITHERRLRAAGTELTEFLDRLAPLTDRLGPTSIQLPPSFAPDDLPVLAAFVRALPRDRPWAVEVRHRGFFAGGPAEQPLDELLRAEHIERVILDTRSVYAGPRLTAEEVDEIRTKPDLPVRPVATGRHPVVRFIGQTDPEANPAFWEPWVRTCARWLGAGLEPYVFLHTPDNVWSPDLARRFHAEVAAVVPGLSPLPWPA